MKFTKCCCCFGIKTGAYIIGSLHVLGLIVGILTISPLQIAVDVFCGGTFLWMVFRDSESKRMYYLGSYCIYVLVNLTIFAAMIWDKSDEVKKADQACMDIEAKL